MAKTKILRYNEEEFISLLENIVKRVKKEELNESMKNRTTKRVVKKNNVRKKRK
jgi:hypothetical protein